MSQLEDVIRAEIAARGPITFARFMELALYHPQHGYYTAPDAPQRIGRAGDYYTSVAVGKLFGELLARQFTEMWEVMGKPAAFTLLELGAHRGQFEADVKNWVARERPDFAAAVHYETRDYPGELPAAIEGCIFSNELFDALPVHRVTYQGDRWQELHVTERDEKLSFVTGELSSDELRDTIRRLQSGTGFQPVQSSSDEQVENLFHVPEGYSTEVCLEARRLMQRIAHTLTRGFVLTIDYGFAAEDYYTPHRKDGTLLCYHQHRANNEPLARVGEQDITAHVNFTALVEHGPPLLGFTDQSHFITGIVEKHLATIDAKEMAQLKTLMHPELMGRTFKVLLQHRGMNGARLSGMKFARDYVT